MRAHCAHSLSLYALLIIVSGEEESCWICVDSASARLSFLLKTPHAAVLDEETRRPCETHLLKAFTHAMHAVAQALGLGLLSFNTSVEPAEYIETYNVHTTIHDYT